MEDMTAQYKRFAVVPIEDVLPIISKYLNEPLRKKIRDDVAGYKVKVTGVRLRTFAMHGTTCSKCGLQATHFAIETTKFGTDHGAHLNLWASTPEGEVLITHDHTLARGLGGKDHPDNTTTMCRPCNAEKSVAEGIEYRARKLE